MINNLVPLCRELVSSCATLSLHFLQTLININVCEWLVDTHKKLKQQVVVWILVLKADRTLFLQVDSINKRDCALVSVGLQVVSLRDPGGTAKDKNCSIILYQLANLIRIHGLYKPIAGEAVISTGTVFQGGCQAAESSRHGIPLVEANATTQRIASCCTLGALLSRHLKELPSHAWKG